MLKAVNEPIKAVLSVLKNQVSKRQMREKKMQMNNRNESHDCETSKA